MAGVQTAGSVPQNGECVPDHAFRQRGMEYRYREETWVRELTSPIALTSGTKVSMSLELWRLDAGPDYPAALESLPVVTVRGEDVTGPRRASSVVSGSASSLLTKRILTTVPRTLVSRLPKHSWPRPKPKTPRPQPLHVVHPAALEVC